MGETQMSALPCTTGGGDGAAVEEKDVFTRAEGFQDSSMMATQPKKRGESLIAGDMVQEVG
jgi:hypothetical protein